MTKKHFIALADLIKAHGFTYGSETQVISVERLADFLAEQNPKFNRERWLGYIADTNGKNGGKR